MKIYLVGMPASGKSTLGRQLAGRLNVTFVDLDSEIEKHEGKSVNEIFAQNGEDHFRTVESRLLIEWAASTNSFVMATGGGAACYFRGIDVMNESGISVYLDTPLSELLKRTAQNTQRPLLKADEEGRLKILGDLLQARAEYYQRAHITIQNPDAQKVLAAILRT